MEILDPLNGMNAVEPPLAAKVALIITTVQSLQCSHSLALQGYFLQAANLLRAPVEYIVAAHYLQFRPSEYVGFTEDKVPTPKFETMKKHVRQGLRDLVGKKQAANFDEQIQQIYKELNPFSHVDKDCLRLVMKQGERGLTILVGPDEDANLYAAWAGRAAFLLSLLILTLVWTK